MGLEGAGHHLWTEVLEKPLFDCVWINARHYKRDIGDGVPRTTVAELKSGFMEQFKHRSEAGLPACKRIYDAEDSFPTGAIRKGGRVFMRPDLVNLQLLDGVLFDVKYLLIVRNTTVSRADPALRTLSDFFFSVFISELRVASSQDTAMSALRRNFFTSVDQELRTVEHTLTYLEAALRM